jgi:hypothetical protein
MSTASEGKRLLGLIRGHQKDSRSVEGGTLFIRQRTLGVGKDIIRMRQDLPAEVAKTEKGV